MFVHVRGATQGRAIRRVMWVCSSSINTKKPLVGALGQGGPSDQERRGMEAAWRLLGPRCLAYAKAFLARRGGVA
jgi:hypothetical protein